MKELNSILQAFGDVAHWTIRPAPDIGNLSLPTIISWRYQQPSQEASDFFRRVVSAYRGAIAWEFSGVGPTWTLMPSRVKEYSRTHQDIGGMGAAEILMSVDPEFGKRANADLSSLVVHMERQLLAGGKTQTRRVLAAG